MSCGPVACGRFLQWRVIGRPPETQSSRGAGGSGLQGIGAAPGPGPGLPRAVECQKPSSERKHDNDDDVSALPEAKRRIWRSLAKPKQARNFKDLKGLKCRYTLPVASRRRWLRSESEERPYMRFSATRPSALASIPGAVTTSMTKTVMALVPRPLTP